MDLENNNKNKSSSPHGRHRDRSKPNIVHPVIPGAVGSHESPYQEGRDSISDAKRIIDDAIENIRGKSS